MAATFGGNRLEQGIHTCGASRVGMRATLDDLPLHFVGGELEREDPKQIIQDVVPSAENAFEVFRCTATSFRKEILCSISSTLLVQGKRRSAGQPQQHQSCLDALRASSIYEYYAHWEAPDNVEGRRFDHFTDRASGVTCTSFEALGVIAAVISRDDIHPLTTIAHTVAPALRCGNCVVVKLQAHEQFHESAIRTMALALQEAAVPAGTIALISGDGTKVGAELVAHPLVSKVVYSGSHRHADFVAESCLLSRPTKPLDLSLRFKTPMVVLADADIAIAVRSLIVSLLDHYKQLLGTVTSSGTTTASAASTTIASAGGKEPSGTSHGIAAEVSSGAFAGVAAVCTELAVVDHVYVHSHVWDVFLLTLTNSLVGHREEFGQCDALGNHFTAKGATGAVLQKVSVMNSSSAAETVQNKNNIHNRVMAKCLCYVQHEVAGGVEMLDMAQAEEQLEERQQQEEQSVTSSEICRGFSAEEEEEEIAHWAQQPPAPQLVFGKVGPVAAVGICGAAGGSSGREKYPLVSAPLSPTTATPLHVASTTTAEAGAAAASAGASGGSTTDAAAHTQLPIVLVSYHDDDLTNSHHHSQCRTALHGSTFAHCGKHQHAAQQHSLAGDGSHSSNRESFLSVGRSTVSVGEIAGPLLHLHRAGSTSDLLYLANTQHHHYKNCYCAVFGSLAGSRCCDEAWKSRANSTKTENSCDTTSSQNSVHGSCRADDLMKATAANLGGGGLLAAYETDTSGAGGGDVVAGCVGSPTMHQLASCLTAPMLLNNSINISLYTHIRDAMVLDTHCARKSVLL